MLQIRLHAKFLVLVLGSLSIFLGVLSYALVQRESNILAQKPMKNSMFWPYGFIGPEAEHAEGEPQHPEFMDSIAGPAWTRKRCRL
jgi:hypothetical protein